MRKLHVILLTVFMLLISMCSFAQTWSAGDPISYVGITGSNTMYIPVGCQGTVAILTHDKDYYGTTPYNMRLTGTLTTVSGYTASHSMNGNGDCTIAFTKTSNTPLYDDLTQVGYSISDDVDDKDYDKGFPDGVINGTTNLSSRSWFGPTGNIQGPTQICPNATITYCVPVGPTEANATTGAYFYWYITSGAQPDDNAVGVQGTYANGYSKFVFPTKPKGKYTLWVRAEKDGVKSPWAQGKSISVVVDYPQDLPQCNGSSSCSSGCGSSSGIDLKTGYVSPVGVYQLFMSPHIRYITGDSESSDLKKCAGTQKIEYIQYSGCNGTSALHVHVWTACGNAYCINESQWVHDDQLNIDSFTLPNGDIITKSNTSGNIWSFNWSTVAGDTVTHIVTRGEDGSHEVSGVTHLDGSSTTRSITGNVTTYKDNPSGATSPIENKYTVDSGNVTLYQRVINGAVTNQTSLTYTGGKVTHVVNSQPNELNKEISLSYDANGNLASVTQNGKVTRYTRTVDAQNKPKTTVTIEDEYGTLYGKTEYLFDTYTTTVTVKDVNNLLSDQVTTYYYVVDGGGNKRYQYKVVDALGNVTVAKVYAPADYTTCDGTITSATDTDYVKYSINSNLWGSPISVTQLYGTTNARTVNSYVYDTLGRITSVTYPTVNKGVYGSPVTETSVTPKQTMSYTGYRLTGVTDIDGSSSSYTYNSYGQLTQDQKTRGGITVTTTYGYTTSSGPISWQQVVTSSPSSTWRTEYSYYSSGAQAGLLYNEKFKNGSGNVQWEKTYNYLQNSVVQPGATSTTTVYYNTNGTVYKTVNDSSSYDSYGNLVSRTDTNNKTVSYSKTTSSNQKIERTIYASGVYSEIVSDCCKTLYSTDIDGKTTYYVYDNIGRLVKTYTNDAGQSETTPLVVNAFDGFGRTASVTTRSNANTSRVTSYTYDSLNRVTKIDNPGLLYDENTFYDVYGNVLATSKGTGTTVMYRYDAMNRVTDEYYLWNRPNPLVLPTTTADKHNIYVEATNTFMAENAYRYTTNGLGQLTSVYWFLTGKTTSYTYDTLGRKASYTHDGNVTAYTYDPMGNLSTVTLNGNAVSSYTYDNAGNRTRVDFGNGTWQTFSYGNDARYLMTGIDYAYKCDSNDTVTNKGGIRLTRSNGGNPLSWADNTDKFIKTFSYDTQGRLANADIPGVSRTDYGYDWVGNRTSPTAVYNTADQLTSFNGNNYVYLGDGGMYTGAGRTFGYYSNGDPYQVSLNGVSKNGKFDPHGLREVTYGAATTKYSYDITASTPAMISEGPYDGTTTYFYVREPGGELIMRKSGTDYKYYHFDELGSTLLLTDANGIQTDKYVYNAWGKVVSSSGSTVNPYRYVGRYGYYYDAETNLYLLGKRYYDADAGVFCQRDAAKDGMSYYAYTSGKVMTATDPWGEVKFILPIKPTYKIKICYRNLVGCTIKHAYLLVGGRPLGYGPGDYVNLPHIGEIGGDVEELENGVASCSPLYELTDTQVNCIRDIKAGRKMISGNWRPGWFFNYRKNGSYCLSTHDCFDYVRAVLDACGARQNLVDDYNSGPGIGNRKRIH